jgi:hypothetical protein
VIRERQALHEAALATLRRLLHVQHAGAEARTRLAERRANEFDAMPSGDMRQSLLLLR